ncbi:hypothetical protein E1A91_D06G125800v1 [Gossypium mustelinum]|uniref:IBB domain-containing protein n=2 Tax=Gossypium TaxID=3633 RepID=A0A5D2UKN5_GOSMU|nr:hypothetical protein E1A91_D06G125800v1 [Gossypium mustelinum]
MNSSLGLGLREDVIDTKLEVAVDAEEGRRRREYNMVEIRKNHREESLQKKRREGLQAQPMLASLHSSAVEKKLENLPAMVVGTWANDSNMQLEATTQFRKLLSIGSTEMPNAMETIFQAALALGRHGGVDELMGDMESAALLYSKAERLLVFLLVEAPSLILNPPFSLTNLDRYRL